jgi:hypothetical protein
MTTLWDESYPPSIFPPVIVPVASVTAGTPGAFAPGDATIPANLTALRADPVVGDAGTNKPGAAWTEGQYVVLANAGHAYWDGTGWQTGNTPAPPAPPEEEPAAAPVSAQKTKGSTSA